MNIEIHPLIRQIQERANRLAKEYDIEDEVMSAFNLMIYNTNSNYNLIQVTKSKCESILLITDDNFVDHIYTSYNGYNSKRN